MGRKKRVGRDRDNGPDPLGRLAAPAPSTQPWGVTGMPSWLDTPEGRNAWSEHDDVDPDGETESGGGVETAPGNDDPDWRPHRPEVGDRRDDDPDDDWDDDWDDDDGNDGWDEVLGEAPEKPGLESLGDDDDDEGDWEPPRRRLAMLPPAAIGLILVGMIACGIAGYSLLKQNEPAAPLVAFDDSASISAPRSESAPRPTTPPNDGQIIVSVVGLVHKPGLVRMVNTARVADAIDRAGGARPGADLLSLNLAQLLHDGDQILVGKGEGTVKSAVVSAAGGAPDSAPPGPGGSEPANGTGLIDLNTATAEQLDALPGVGPVTAAAIIAWRQANGRFTSVDQLAEVDGIGPARLAKLTPLVTVG